MVVACGVCRKVGIRAATAAAGATRGAAEDIHRRRPAILIVAVSVAGTVVAVLFPPRIGCVRRIHAAHKAVCERVPTVLIAAAAVIVLIAATAAVVRRSRREQIAQRAGKIREKIAAASALSAASVAVPITHFDTSVRSSAIRRHFHFMQEISYGCNVRKGRRN